MTIKLHCSHPGGTAQAIVSGRHALLSDMPVAEGGADEGPSPHALYDAALGACKALTVMWYARKKGIPVDDAQTDDPGAHRSDYHGGACPVNNSSCL